MIRAVIFDAFEVLFLNASGHFFDKHIRDEGKRSAFNAINEASDRNELTYEERIRGLAEAVDVPYEFLKENLYIDLVRNEALFRYAKELSKKYKIALLSNTGEGSIEQFISDKELDESFDEVILSHKAGYVKPQVEIFELTAKKLRVATDECVFIDDSSKNCEGAKRAGMKTIQYKNFDQCIKELEAIL